MSSTTNRRPTHYDIWAHLHGYLTAEEAPNHEFLGWMPQQWAARRAEGDASEPSTRRDLDTMGRWLCERHGIRLADVPVLP